MAVTWSWEEKRGEITSKKSNGKNYVTSIYEGNCPLISLYEFKENGEDMYNMHMFFIDDSHAKRCLGLTKEKDNLYPDVTKIKISREHRHFKKIVKWFSEAYPNITIEIYTENENEKGDK